MIVRAFITHKQAEQFSDCQDRFDVNIDTKSLAVSDGMGSTWQQKIWAQLLVETFTKRNNWLPTHESIKPLCKTWHQTIDSIIQNMKDTNAPANIIYRNERNLAEGRSAGATFVGIRINGNDWQGSVLGDSCLIEWDGSKAKFYTSQDVEEFDSYPDYFDSDELKQGKGTPKDISGTLEKGGYLLLVSDPFSDFLFEHNKQGDVSMYMQQLLKLSSHDEFETLVDEWRKAGMPNDDTTLVIVEPDDSDEFSIEKDKYDDINKFIDEEKKLIEENKKEEVADQIPAPISNKQTESDPDTNAIVFEDKQVKQSEKQIESPQVIIPSDNAIEEIIEEAEQIPVPDSNKQTKSEADTNAVLGENSQIKLSEKQIESPQLIIPSDNAIEEHKDEKGNTKLVPVEAEAFVDELLTDYKYNTDGFFDSIKYGLTEDAVKKAGYSIFKKYNIFKK